MKNFSRAAKRKYLSTDETVGLSCGHFWWKTEEAKNSIRALFVLNNSDLLSFAEFELDDRDLKKEQFALKSTKNEIRFALVGIEATELWWQMSSSTKVIKRDNKAESEAIARLLYWM